MELGEALTSLGLALLLGLLVGLQRERTKPRVAGLRTFGLITVLGTATAIVADALPGGAWVVAAGFLAVMATLVVGNVISLRTPEPAHPGTTTEVAALVMYVVGVMLVTGPREAALAVGGSVAILLQLKPRMQGFVAKLGDDDVTAIMRFALLSAVILPIVPNRTMGPFQVLNPQQIWLMVVLVVGMSLGGYLLYRFVGERVGLVLSALFGGLISSTATTVSYARRALTSPDQITAATFVITGASTVLYARLLTEISVAAPDQFWTIAPPVGAMGVVTLLLALAVWRRASKLDSTLPPQQNPTEMKTALVFGAIYAVVLVAVAAAQHYLGDRGTYAVAAISGITDMDAITLSSSRMAAEGKLPADTAWRAIIIASMANGVFKCFVVITLAGWGLGRRILALFAIKLAAAGAVLLLWPA